MFTALFGSIAIYYLWSALEGILAYRWPLVPGEVESWSIEEEPSRFSRGYTPTVIYSYLVAGTKYQGKRLRFGNNGYFLRASAESRLSPYLVSSNVRVRYDPRRPGRAVLEPGVGASTIFNLVFFCLALGVVVILLLRAIR